MLQGEQAAGGGCGGRDGRDVDAAAAGYIRPPLDRQVRRYAEPYL